MASSTRSEAPGTTTENGHGLLVGLDVGGTFTDCVVVDSSGTVRIGKGLTTHGNYLEGILTAISSCAEPGSVEDLLGSSGFLKHGTTVGTNAIITRSGASVAMLTTKGFEDTLFIMRAHGRHVDLAPEEILNFTQTSKPEPLIPRKWVAGIAERVDYAGREVVRLDEDAVAEAAARFASEGVEAVAISFLWSFANPAHEQRAKEIVREQMPDAFISLSSEVAPKLGEYERGAAATVNAYLGPAMSSYLEGLRGMVQEHGFEREPLIVQCTGGVISAEHAAQEPLGTIDSGPVAGLVGSTALGAQMGLSNIVTTDMGGTSFDVGVITDGVPVKREITVVEKYECFIPRLDVRTIGSGGGSIIWVDDQGRLNSGPQSAGSDPGPAFLGRGGTEPTIADANMILGFLDPSSFFGGRIDVDRDAAEVALSRVAEQIGMSSPVDVAAAAVTITEHKMADLIRRVTIEQGYDVRDFVTFAYGGSSGIHAAAYARELGIDRVIVPLGSACSTWSALGAAVSNVRRVFDYPLFMDTPLEMGAIRERFAELEREGRQETLSEGVEEADVVLERYALMRHKAQVYEVPIPVDDELLEGDAQQLLDTFEERYETLYGEGSAFPAGGITVDTLRVEASGIVFRGSLPKAGEKSAGLAPEAKLPAREIYWPDLRESIDTQVYEGSALRYGDTIEGPGVVQSDETTVVVPTGATLEVDEFGSYLINTGASKEEN
ncbi:MAG TPA: hydantoinase/oxoprolinase family protein [Solirubrobacterales bacterium]|jgi:N-methylhydantoinase A